MNINWLAIILLVVAVVWTIIVRKKYPDKTFDWWNTLVATFLTTSIAVIIGLWIYNYQVDDANQRQRKDLTELLKLEFSRVTQSFNGEQATVQINGTPTKVLITHIEPIGIEKAAQSGSFNATDTSKLLQIAQWIRVYDLEVEFFYTAFNTEPASKDSLSRTAAMAQNIELARQSILSDIAAEAKALNIDLNEVK